METLPILLLFGLSQLSRVASTEAVRGLAGEFAGSGVDRAVGVFGRVATSFLEACKAKPDVVINHDVQRALRRAYLRATLQLLEAFLTSQGAALPNLARRISMRRQSGDVRWVAKVHEALSIELVSLAKLAHAPVGPVLDSSTISNWIVTSEGSLPRLLSEGLSKELETLSSLNLNSPLGQGRPGCVPPALLELADAGWANSDGSHTTWLALLADYLHDAIRSNHALHLLIQDSVIAKIDDRLAGIEQGLQLGAIWRHPTAQSLDAFVRFQATLATYAGREVGDLVETLVADLPPIVGRHAERRDVLRAISRREQLVIVDGPAAVGKTSFLADLITSLGEAEHEVVLHLHDARYPTTIDAHRAYLNLLRQILAVHGEPDFPYPESEPLLRDTLYGLLKKPCPDGRHLVVLIDGLDEAREEFSWLLDDVSGHVTIVVSVRSETPVASALSNRYPRAPVVSVGPLNASDIASLLATSGVEAVRRLADSAQTVQTILQQTHGLPLYARFLIEELEASSIDGRRLGEVLQAAPPALSDYVRSQWRQLAAQATNRKYQALFALVAVSPEPIPQNVAAVLCDLTEWDLQAIPKHIGRWFRIAIDGSLTFTHSLLAAQFRQLVSLTAQSQRGALRAYCDEWVTSPDLFRLRCLVPLLRAADDQYLLVLAADPLFEQVAQALEGLDSPTLSMARREAFVMAFECEKIEVACALLQHHADGMLPGQKTQHWLERLLEAARRPEDAEQLVQELLSEPKSAVPDVLILATISLLAVIAAPIRLRMKLSLRFVGSYWTLKNLGIFLRHSPTEARTLRIFAKRAARSSHRRMALASLLVECARLARWDDWQEIRALLGDTREAAWALTDSAAQAIARGDHPRAETIAGLIANRFGWQRIRVLTSLAASLPSRSRELLEDAESLLDVADDLEKPWALIDLWAALDLSGSPEAEGSRNVVEKVLSRRPRGHQVKLRSYFAQRLALRGRTEAAVSQISQALGLLQQGLDNSEGLLIHVCKQAVVVCEPHGLVHLLDSFNTQAGRAEALCEIAIELAGANRQDVAAALGRLVGPDQALVAVSTASAVLSNEGATDKALLGIERALRPFTETSPTDLPATTVRFAVAHHLAGQSAPADAFWQAGLSVVGDLPSAHSRAWELLNIAAVPGLRKETALAILRRAARLTLDMRDFGAIRFLSSAAILAINLGSRRLALGLLHEAEERAPSADGRFEVNGRCEIAEALAGIGEREKASAQLLKAFERAKQVRMAQRHMSMARIQLSAVAMRMEEPRGLEHLGVANSTDARKARISRLLAAGELDRAYIEVHDVAGRSKTYAHLLRDIAMACISAKRWDLFVQIITFVAGNRDPLFRDAALRPLESSVAVLPSSSLGRVAIEVIASRRLTIILLGLLALRYPQHSLVLWETVETLLPSLRGPRGFGFRWPNQPSTNH